MQNLLVKQIQLHRWVLTWGGLRYVSLPLQCNQLARVWRLAHEVKVYTGPSSCACCRSRPIFDSSSPPLWLLPLGQALQSILIAVPRLCQVPLHQRVPLTVRIRRCRYLQSRNT